MWPLTGLEIARVCSAAATDEERLLETRIAGTNVGDRPASHDELFVALREDGWDGHERVAEALSEGAALALVAADWTGRASLDPSLAERCLVVDDTLRAFRVLAAHLRRGFSFPVVAVGGSNGKTTTKDMIAALLAGPDRLVTTTPETMNGWSGIPVTLAQRAHARDTPPAGLVVEVGIDAAGAMEDHARVVDADIAVLTALGAEHLAGLGDEDGVVREETKLFESSPRLRRVFMMEDPRIAEAAAGARAGDLLVATEDRAGDLTARGLGVVSFVVAEPDAGSLEVTIAWRPPGATAVAWRRAFVVPMPGRHNAENFALAAAVAIALDRAPDAMASSFASFHSPSMRCELRPLRSDGVLVDDAYNASPASMEAALDLLERDRWRDRRKVLVLADMLDLGAAAERFHLALVPRLEALAKHGARVLLYGDAMQVVARALETSDVVVGWAAASADPCALLDSPGLDLDGAIVLVKGSRGMRLERVVAEVAQRARHASEEDLEPFRARFRSVCVTGTNGKTTTTSLVAAIVAASGETACRVTTIGAWVGNERTGEEPTGNAFLHTLRIAAARGVRTLAIETTSHALGHGFARSWPPRVAVFTNLSRDHLDHHGTAEEYLAAKAQLFMSLPEDGVAVLNVADPSSALLDEVTPAGVTRLGYAAREPDPACASIPVALRAVDVAVDVHGTHARLLPSPLASALGDRIDLALVGNVHMENALAAALAAHALGYDAAAIRAAFASFAGVPGRFEIVSRAPLVVVDYAHTPDALARTLGVARSLVGAARVLCVFGCGGERDAGKRPEMGAIAARLADVVVITSDNPRSEDPVRIADAVEEGAREGKARLVRLLDRGAAIRAALEMATAADIVVIAGKGHEKTQTIGGVELPFDDVEIAREAWRARKGDGER